MGVRCEVSGVEVEWSVEVEFCSFLVGPTLATKRKEMANSQSHPLPPQHHNTTTSQHHNTTTSQHHNINNINNITHRSHDFILASQLRSFAASRFALAAR